MSAERSAPWTEEAAMAYIANMPQAIDCDAILARELHLGVGVADLLALRQRGGKTELAVVQVDTEMITPATVASVASMVRALRASLPHDQISVTGIIVGHTTTGDALWLAEEAGYIMYLCGQYPYPERPMNGQRQPVDVLPQDQASALTQSATELGTLLRQLTA